MAQNDGFIAKMQADSIGKASMLLGAGRVKLEDSIDYDAGIIFAKSFGDYIKKGEIIATLYSSKNDFAPCISELEDAIILSNEKPQEQPLIFDVI